MKYTVSNDGYEIVALNTPVANFEEIKIATTDGSDGYVVGNFSWDRLKVDSDLTPLIGKWFDLNSPEWSLSQCIVCEDKKSIFFKHALKNV